MSKIDIEAIELLKQDYELGIYSKEEYEAELTKLGGEPIVESSDTFDYKLDGLVLKIYRHIDLIKDNLKSITRMVLENKWGQRGVIDDKIIIVNGIAQEYLPVYSITYINKYGQFIEVDLNDIILYLDKIDFYE